MLLTSCRAAARLDARGNGSARLRPREAERLAAGRQCRAAVAGRDRELCAAAKDLPEGLRQGIIAHVEKHAPLSRAGDQGSAELDKADLEQFAKFLRGKGIDEETINGAMKLVGDVFPPNALHGGALGRGAGPGAALR